MENINAKNNQLNKNNQPNQQIIKSSTAPNTTTLNTVPKPQNANPFGNKKPFNSKSKSSNVNKSQSNSKYQQPNVGKKKQFEEEAYNPGHKNIKYKNNFNLAKLHKQNNMSMCDDSSSCYDTDN